MVFSSVNFLYYFLPILLLVYFSVPSKGKNLVLFLFSLGFYYYGEPVYTLLLLFSSVSGYVHGLLIERSRNTRFAKVPLVSSIVFGLGALGFFKYSDFFLENVNRLFGADYGLIGVVLPIGISFYTFQVLSYTIDVYRGKVGVQRNLLDFMTYVALFPQLVAGPIVRYETIENQLKARKHSVEDVYVGVKRFMVGLAKKVLIADTLAEVVAHFDSAHELSVLFYWLMAIAFTLQIYYDFSGYSDMAIGLGRILGFRFLENFNYPYIAKSVTEFWRRWHISLGEWFRRYVYIPMGGNRVNILRFIRNLLVVWFLTGFWHGPAWNFVVWGLMYGVLLIVEKLFIKDRMESVPAVLRHAYVMFVVVIGFVLFNADSLQEGVGNIMGLFALRDVPLSNVESLYFLRSYAVVIVLAIFGSTPLLRNALTLFQTKPFLRKSIWALEPAMVLVLLVMVTGNLVDGTFNPFIYFRF